MLLHRVLVQPYSRRVLGVEYRVEVTPRRVRLRAPSESGHGANARASVRDFAVVGVERVRHRAASQLERVADISRVDVLQFGHGALRMTWLSTSAMLQGAAVPRKSLRLNRARRPPFVSRQPLRFIDSRAGRPLRNRHSRAGWNPGVGEGMGSRLHGNDGRAPHPYPSGVTQRSPQAGIHGGECGWVPVSTGTTDARPTLIQVGLRKGLAQAGIQGRERGWVPVSTGTTDARPTLIQVGLRKGLRRRESGWERGWVPVSTGTTDARPTLIQGGYTKVSAGGNPGVGEGMGFRLHGNDGRRRVDRGRSRS